MQLLLSLLVAALLQVTTASVLTPPVLPLIVRNPYLSTWLGNARDVPWSKWPMFYTGEEIGLSLMVEVPHTGTIYPLVGKPHEVLSPDLGYGRPIFCQEIKLYPRGGYLTTGLMHSLGLISNMQPILGHTMTLQRQT